MKKNASRLHKDEGVAIFEVLVEYSKTAKKSEFLSNAIDLTRRMSIFYPLYLNLHQVAHVCI